MHHAIGYRHRLFFRERASTDQLSKKIELLLSSASGDGRSAIVRIMKTRLVKSNLCGNGLGQCRVALIGSKLQSALCGRYCIGKSTGSA